MKYLLLNLLIFFFLAPASAQFKHDYNWVIGTPWYEGYISGLTFLNFNNDSLKFTHEMGNDYLYLTNASISNSNGELLFYSNGCYITDASFNIMENGEGLNPGFAYLSGNCPDFGNGVRKGMIILPFPGDSTKYYAIHESLVLGETGLFSLFVGFLYYSVVDMTKNNGLGAVSEKNKVILNDSLYGDLHAVKHINGKDWWIIVSKTHRNRFYKVLLTEDGIADTLEQNIGPDPDPFISGATNATFSPDGTMYVRYDFKNQVTLCDFDRSSGLLSNYRQLLVDTAQLTRGSAAFSSNSRYLYVCNQKRLYQFDLQASNIQDSKILIAEYNGYIFQNHPTYFGLMQLGPDCKIYLAAMSASDDLSVIHSPDQPGLACNFEQQAISLLPGANASSMPNFPNYRLGTPYPVCDSSIVYLSAGHAVPQPVAALRLWPNPATTTLHLASELPLPGSASLRLHTLTGQCLRTWPLQAGVQEQTFPLEGLPPGLYFWQVEHQGRPAGGGKVIVME